MAFLFHIIVSNGFANVDQLKIFTQLVIEVVCGQGGINLIEILPCSHDSAVSNKKV